MDDYTSPHLSQSLLITIDTQNDFTLPGAPAHIPGTLEVIPNMVRLLNAYRAQALPIIHVIRFYLPDGSNAELCRRKRIEEGCSMLTPQSEGAELVAALKPAANIKLDSAALLSGRLQQIGSNEIVIYKPRWGAFYATRLEQTLRSLDVDTLVFSGCNFPNCPRTSIYQASERDFRIVLAKDALSGLYPQGEQEMMNIGVNLMTADEILGQLSR